MLFCVYILFINLFNWEMSILSEGDSYRLLIEMIRRGNYPQKRQLLNFLERSSLSCDKTNEFTQHKWNHYKEYIYTTVEPSDLLEMMEYKKYIEQIIEKYILLTMNMNMSFLV